MDRYKTRFKELKRNKEKALIGFSVLGDPDKNTSIKIIKTMIESGVDILEVALAFSDPIADGPTIQAADVRALKKRITTDIAFDIIKEIRKSSSIPIGLLVYYNLIYQKGIDNFYRLAKESGVDSVLIADLPIEESEPVIKVSRKYNINQVFIVSELTNNQRLKKITKKTSGFVYTVARLGVTGARSDLKYSTLSLVRRIKKHTKLPVCVGFGVSKPEHVKKIAKSGADGIIVGSAIVKIIEKNYKNKKIMLHKIKNYIKKLKKATL